MRLGQIEVALVELGGMASDDRTVVKTYVPRYQKEKWVNHAEELGMSQSEFVRTMVQAGSRDFEIPSLGKDTTNINNQYNSEDNNIEERIISILNQKGVLDWDELVDHLTSDIEDDLDLALGHLQDDNRIRYNGRKGGYALTQNE